MFCWIFACVCLQYFVTEPPQAEVSKLPAKRQW